MIARNLINDSEINKRLLNVMIKNKYFKHFRLAALLAILILLFFAMPLIMPNTSAKLFNGY
ncbi:MAG: hypothetical protein AB7U52_05270, partial [Candidatus Izemoplasmatales bacterium]